MNQDQTLFDVELERHDIRIMRDAMVHIPKKVFDHELKIIQALEGEDRVSVVSTETVLVEGFDVEAEYERLERLYQLSGDKEIVKKIYGHNAKKLAEDIGLDYTAPKASKVKQQLAQSLEVDNAVDSEAGKNFVDTTKKVTVKATAKKKAAAAGKKAAANPAAK